MFRKNVIIKLILFISMLIFTILYFMAVKRLLGAYKVSYIASAAFLFILYFFYIIFLKRKALKAIDLFISFIIGYLMNLFSLYLLAPLFIYGYKYIITDFIRSIRNSELLFIFGFSFLLFGWILVVGCTVSKFILEKLNIIKY